MIFDKIEETNHKRKIAMSLFSCPLCAAPLTREEGRYRCPQGHCFDLAREGYVHLLPPNRKHSANPGDDREMIAARTRFLEGRYYAPLRDALVETVARHATPRHRILDVGCGEGYYTQGLAQIPGSIISGVDLSKAGVKKAARRVPGGEFAVASVYHLPLGDAQVDVVVDCFAPLAIEEYRRVLAPGGLFVYVVPAPLHLMELKKVLYDTPYPNPEEAVEYEGFTYVEILPLTTTFTLPNPQAISDLFGMTPYAWKSPKAGVERLHALESLTVTGDFRIHIFRRN